MRTPESEIKEAILHPVEEVRLTAVDYFSYGDDPTVMPLVIEAVEKYGRKNGFSILRDAERLTQTKESTAWLVDELKKKWNPGDVHEDNYRVAVALLLCRADWGALTIPLDDVLGLPSFPKELSYEVRARTTTKSIGWDCAWEGFLRLGESTRAAGRLSRADKVLLEEMNKARAIVAATSVDDWDYGQDALLSDIDEIIIELERAAEKGVQASLSIA